MAKASIPPFKKLAAQIQRSVDRDIVPAITATLEREREGFQRYIRQQRFPAVLRVPLSRLWAAKKRRLGLDSRTLISTGHYVSNIRVYARADRARKTRSWSVDVPPLMRARTPEGRTSPLLLRRLAAYQEYGASSVPSRPHWRPYWMSANRRIAASISNANIRAVRSINRAMRRTR